MGRKRATGKTGMYKYPSGSSTSAKAANSSIVGSGAASRTKSAGTGNMGVGKGKAGRMTQGGDIGGLTAGRARTRKGKNDTGSGPQGMKG